MREREGKDRDDCKQTFMSFFCAPRSFPMQGPKITSVSKCTRRGGGGTHKRRTITCRPKKGAGAEKGTIRTKKRESGREREIRAASESSFPVSLFSLLRDFPLLPPSLFSCTTFCMPVHACTCQKWEKGRKKRRKVGKEGKGHERTRRHSTCQRILLSLAPPRHRGECE